MTETVTVQKLNPAGVVTVTWAGTVLERTATSVRLAATFTRGPMVLDYVTLKPGDRFIEQFFADKWYNVFAVYDADDGTFKGWYCNITRPAEIGPNPDGSGLLVRAVDLALDYFRQPGGAEFILDEAEFADLKLEARETALCREALAELQALAAAGAGPFAPAQRSPEAG